jgi:ribosomal protein RSM22 (predicted rRNA methylase)
VVAPCPHGAPCPLATAGPPDWCHFAVRVNRSSLHRRVKGATLGYEDEKFAYVAAVAPGAAGAAVDPSARVLRNPVRRKGLVQLRLCTVAVDASGRAEPSVGDVTISRRQGARYRAARDVSWGDAWPPHDR